MIHLTATQIDVKHNTQPFVNTFLLLLREHGQILSKPACIYFQFQRVIFFFDGILPLPYTPPFTIFNYARDLPLFHRRAVGGCSPTCQLSRKLWNCTLLHFNIRNCSSINCYIFQDKQPFSLTFYCTNSQFCTLSSSF